MLPSAILFIVICYECVYGNDDDYNFLPFIRYKRKRTMKIDLEVWESAIFFLFSFRFSTVW